MRTIENPMSQTTKGVIVVGAGVAMLAGVITAGVLLSKKSAAPSAGGAGPVTAPSGGKPGGKPTSRTTAQWMPITVDPTTEAIYPPVGSTIAVSVPAGDPLIAVVAATVPKGATRSPAGNSPPTGFPADGRGTKAFRAIFQAPAGGFSMKVSRNTLAWIQKIVTVTIEPVKA